MPASTAAVSSVVGLADPAEHDALGREARGERAGQLAAGDDVRAGAEVAQHPEHREVRVRLDRVGDPVRHRRQRLVERAELPPDHVGVVDVGRRADPVGDGGERDAAEVERRPAPLEAGVGEQPAVRLTPPPAAASVRSRPYRLRHAGPSAPHAGRPARVGRAELLVGQHADGRLGLLLDLRLARRAAAEAGVDEPAAGLSSWARNCSLVAPRMLFGLAARARRLEQLALHRVHGSPISVAASPASGRLSFLPPVRRASIDACRPATSRGPSSSRSGTPRTSHS